MLLQLLVRQRVHFAERLVEPLLELFARAEDLGKKEVKERPELCQIVLKWSASEQDSMSRDVLLAQGLSELGLGVLHAMTFVDDDVLPLDLAQGRLVVQDILVRGQYDVELLVFEMLGEDGSFVFLALISDDPD